MCLLNVLEIHRQRRVNRSILVCVRPRPGWPRGPVSGRWRARRERAGGPAARGGGRAGSQHRPASRQSPCFCPWLPAHPPQPASRFGGPAVHPWPQEPQSPARASPLPEPKGHFRTPSAGLRGFQKQISSNQATPPRALGGLRVASVELLVPRQRRQPQASGRGARPLPARCAQL